MREMIFVFLPLGCFAFLALAPCHGEEPYRLPPCLRMDRYYRWWVVGMAIEKKQNDLPYPDLEPEKNEI